MARKLILKYSQMYTVHMYVCMYTMYTMYILYIHMYVLALAGHTNFHHA